MKKILCFLITACILISVFSVSAYALDSESIYAGYDYNNDGKVNLSDARTVLKVSAGIEAPAEGKIYDFDGDGYVTYYDVRTVLSIALGIDVDIDESASQEYLLSLLVDELNSVKEKRPGFTKHTSTQCESAWITMSLLGTTYVDGEYRDVMSEYITKEEIDSVYAQQEKTVTTLRNSYYHKTRFLVGYDTDVACALTVNDIKEISCYEKDGYVYRTVTMNEESFSGDKYPGTLEERFKSTSYGKVFLTPDLADDSAELKDVIFKNGTMTVKIDKLTGMPVTVDYSYQYVTTVQTQSEISAGINITTVLKMTANISESYTINPMEAN